MMSVAARSMAAICPAITVLSYSRQQRYCQPPAHCNVAPIVRTDSSSILDVRDYELDKQLGGGAGGTVFRAKHRRTGELFAIKRSPSGDIAGAFDREVRALAALDHPHVVSLVEHFSDTECAYLVEELCSGPDLMDFIDRRPTTLDGIPYVPEREAVALFRQCLEAVAGVHAQGFVHRDVKPDNFVFGGTREQPQLKLVDFGFADRATGETLSGKNFGTVTWMAPEMLLGEEHTAAVDLWSLGALLFTLLSGEPLVPNASDEVARRCLRKPTFARRRVQGADALDRLGVSEEALDLLQRLLEHDPSRRISAAEALAHPFLSGNLGEVAQSE